MGLGLCLATAPSPAQTWSFPAPLNPNAATDSGVDRAPQLTTDGHGTWVAVWEFSGLGGTAGTDFDILFARSADGGATWSDPAPLNTNAVTDSGDDLFPQLTTDGLGIWVAVWVSDDSLGGTGGGDRDILYARSTNGGSTWSDPAPLNSNAAADSGNDVVPRLTTDGLGNWVAVWASDDSLGGTSGDDRDILFARSTNGGSTWSVPAALNSNAAGDAFDDFRPQVATDGLGLWVAVWSSDDTLGGTSGGETDILFARSTDGGSTWSASALLNTNAATDSGNDLVPQLATDGVGTWVAVWASDHSTLGGNHDILFARSTDGASTWSAPSGLNSSAPNDAFDDIAPQLTTDGLGAWMAAWQSDDTLGGTIGTDSDILFARSADGGSTWSEPAPLNSNAATDSGDDLAPQLTADGLGTWVAVWESDETLGGKVHFSPDILFARVEGLGSCTPSAAALCLSRSRFRVSTTWRTSGAAAGQGQAVPLTGDTGYFWFFNPTNVEMVVKVLDACAPPFERFWVFAGGLTDVEVITTVMDTETGQRQVYTNPPGTPFQPLQDTDAFATCP